MSDPFKYPHENNSVAYWKTRHKLLTTKYERLDVINAEMLEALHLCQKVLAMMIEPEEIKKTTVLNAWTQAVEAELKARAAITNALEAA